MSTMRWRWRWVLVVPAVLVGMAALLVWSDAFARLASAAKDASTSAGLTIAEVWVEGRSRTERNALIRVLAAPVGEPSLFVDVDAIVAEVRELDWVADAQARVQLPGRLQVSLQERTPVALWQTGGTLYAIEASGHVIDTVMFRDFPELPLVVGEGANTMLGDLADLFATQPQFASRVDAAIWVSRRRWTLQTDSGLMVHLPEADPSAALTKLTGSAGGIDWLSPSVGAVDLRIPERIVVRMRADAPPPSLPDGV